MSLTLLAGLVTLLATQETIFNPGTAELTGHTADVRAVASAQLNGRPMVISGSDDHTVRVWDLTTGQPIGAPITGHTDAVDAVATAQLERAHDGDLRQRRQDGTGVGPGGSRRVTDLKGELVISRLYR